MATKVKDQATAEMAARNLNKGVPAPAGSEPIASKEKTTTEKLFPEFTTEDGGIVNRPIREDAPAPAPATATQPTAPQPQTPPTATPTAQTYLKPEELVGKVVKLKVDGSEIDVPAESLIKTNQLERHLNSSLQRLAEERARFEVERAAFAASRTPDPAPAAPPAEPPKHGEPAKAPGKKSPELEAVEQELARTQAAMRTMQETLLPQIQQAGIQRVASRVKEAFGTDDFPAYFEQIKQVAIAEVAKPEVARDPNAIRWFDSDQFYFQKYQELKLKAQLSSAPNPSQPPVPGQPPALVTQHSGAPVVVNSQGQPRSIPTIESSGGVPSKPVEGDWAAKAQAAFDKARQTQSMEDWTAYYRLKTSVQ